MMNDTVREELQTKPGHANVPAPAKDFLNLAINSNTVVTAPKPVAAPVKMQATPIRQSPTMPSSAPVTTPKMVSKPAAKYETSDLVTKKTSPTLVPFETKNAQMPDWRLQLQNSIRQRNGGTPSNAVSADANSQTYQKQLVTNGANALKTQYVEEEKPAAHANSKVAAALKRIEDSRNAFLSEGKQVETPAAGKVAAKSNYPFNVVSRSASPANREEGAAAAAATAAKPRLVSSLRIEKKAFSTNKLPPLPKAGKRLPDLEVIPDEPILYDDDLNPVHVTEQAAADEIVHIEEVEIEETDDLAPIAMRFNAGLFDLIIGGFASLILLSPFLLSGGTWLSLSGVLAFAAALAIVMFVYLTASIGYSGRTFGMRVFSLELVDAEEDAYPTLHQAAVNSAVYLLSLAIGGLGLLPIFFNDEKRAAHDLISGTIMIREY